MVLGVVMVCGGEVRRCSSLALGLCLTTCLPLYQGRLTGGARCSVGVW